MTATSKAADARRKVLEALDTLDQVYGEATPGLWEGWSNAGFGVQIPGIIGIRGNHGDYINVKDATFILRMKNSWPGISKAFRTLLKGFQKVDNTIACPAAEYVPAIGDAFTVIDQTLQQALEELETRPEKIPPNPKGPQLEHSIKDILTRQSLKYGLELVMRREEVDGDLKEEAALTLKELAILVDELETHDSGH